MTLDALSLVLLLLLGLGVALLVAPLEALAWWAGWYDEATSPSETSSAPPNFQVAPRDSAQNPTHYVIFLDGISKGSYRDLDYITDFLVALQNALPESRIISGILPYSVFNLELTSRDYPFSRFWSWVEGRKFAGNPVGYLINLRNLLQVMVSADWRYGPLYNVGMTKLILKYLLRGGYGHRGAEASRKSVTLVGYSGGGQVAAGVAPLLARTLKVPVKVVSVAGVMAGNADFTGVERWVQVVSDRDPVEKLGAVVFPLRWRLAWFSPWNRAKRRGVVKLERLDGARHDGRGSYMDKRAPTYGERSRLERTVEIVARTVEA